MESELMERAKAALRRHLTDLLDQVEADDGRIRDPEVLDGIKDCVRSLRWISSMDTPPARVLPRA